ncbi:putative membrane protein with ankyrin repeat [Pseudoalteromonas luteoviolacea B = ATCC 29581]|nr:putative membrane protein with ankyrin repeat [Pseudoalteromonas luteoviolacea B = ATCC 29581]
MEQVLIWPKEYPLLVKGLVEKNGAFILDALESWPQCGQSEDEQGVVSTILPPLFYLQWMKPLEPFEACFFQHIAEFDDKGSHYLNQLMYHFEQSDMSIESQIVTLLRPFCRYSNIAVQAAFETSVSLFKLLFDKRYFHVITTCLEQGACLSADDVMCLWQEVEFRETLTQFIPSQVKDKDALTSAVCKAISEGGDYYTLLLLLSEDDVTEKLEHALLVHLGQSDAKQSMVQRFLEQGAMAKHTNEAGENALHLAANKGFLDVVERLFGAETNIQDHNGNTAIHHAILGNAQSVVKRLIQLGADPKCKNKKGMSAYALAVAERRTAIIKMLEQEFYLKELSEEEQYHQIRFVHSLYFIAAVLLPVQLFFFFDDDFHFKTEMTVSVLFSALLLLFLTRRIRTKDVYPQRRHPWSLILLRVLAWFSVLGLIGLSAVVALTFIGPYLA